MEAYYSNALAVAAGLRVTLPYAQRLQLTAMLSAASGAFLHAAAPHLRPGWQRMALVLPIVVLNAWLPLLFEADAELLSRVLLTFTHTWLANFKAVGLALNRGPLVARDWNLPQFLLFFLAPVYPREDVGGKSGRLSDSAGHWTAMLRRFFASTVLLGAVVYLLLHVSLPWTMMMYIYALGLYAFVMTVMNSAGALIVALLRVELVPPFDTPWAATSLGDFWGRRWNNTTGLLLRALVFDPLVERRWVRSSSTPAAATQQRVSLARKAAGLAATFAVSGLMHEVVLFYVVASHRPFYWFMFFFVQAPILLLETAALGALKARRVALPRAVRVAWWTGAMLVTAHLFFFPPIRRDSDLADRVVDAVHKLYDGAAAAVADQVGGVGGRWWSLLAAAATSGA